MKFLLSLLVALSVAAPVHAQELAQDRIVAKVNTDIVTSGDVWARYRMIQRSSGLPDNAEIRKDAFPQVLNTLIEEKLQLQAARRAGIRVDDGDVDNGVAELAKRNNTTREQFEEAIKKQGVSIDEMRRQLRGQIAWGALVQRTLRNSVNVTEAEVTKLEDELNAQKGKKEFQVAEIVLPADTPQKAKESERLAVRLTNEMARGTRFRDVAPKFSTAASAKAGGLRGWVAPGELPPAVDKIMQEMPVGALSRPLTADGSVWMVLKLAEREGKGAPERKVLKEKLNERKLEQAARTYLNDLRDEALIEFPGVASAIPVPEAAKPADKLDAPKS